MKKLSRILVCGGICLALLFSPGSDLSRKAFVRGDDSLTDATVQSYEQQLAELSRKQEAALAQISALKNDIYEAQNTKYAYDELVNLSIKKKDLTQMQYDSITEQIAAKEALIEEANVNIESQREARLSRLRALQDAGNANYLEILLGATDLVDFLTRVDRVSTMMEYDQHVITSLQENRTQLQMAQAELEHSLELQQSAMEQLEDSIALAQQAAEESRLYMEKLQDDESSAVATYWAAKEKENELNNQLQTYLQELQAKQQSTYVGGTLEWPLPLDVYYQVSSEYGWRTLWGGQDFHLGLDLACACNTNVYAANAGTVLKSEYHYSYGNYVLIDHGGGISTLYAHMNERWVSAGDTVTALQQIGKVGTTGSSSGYHLHFEVRENGSTTDPRGYINLP